MTQEECDREYARSLEELDQILSRAHTLSYRMTHGGVYYNQPKAVIDEGEKVWDQISEAQESFLLFLERIDELRYPKAPS